MHRYIRFFCVFMPPHHAAGVSSVGSVLGFVVASVGSVGSVGGSVGASLVGSVGASVSPLEGVSEDGVPVVVVVVGAVVGGGVLPDVVPGVTGVVVVGFVVDSPSVVPVLPSVGVVLAVVPAGRVPVPPLEVVVTFTVGIT